MKNFFITIFIILLIFEILMFPETSMFYASEGLSLWFHNMIPALFPFMVISGLVIRLNLAPRLMVFIHPVMKKIFHTDVYCEYTIIMGFLCGFPMGAVIIKDLLKEGKITSAKANYLLAFCNNIGPVFFCSVVLPVFPKEYHLILLAGMYGIPMLYGLFLRYTYFRNAFHTHNVESTSSFPVTENDFFTAFTESLNHAVSSSLFLGACMIFFNMLRFLPALLLKNNIMAESISAWLLEVNGAIAFTEKIYQNGNHALALFLTPLLTIGGLSCLCQTIGILQNTECSFRKYLMHKCIQCLLWIILLCVRFFF